MNDRSKTFLGKATQFLEIYLNDRNNFTLVACLRLVFTSDGVGVGLVIGVIRELMT